MEEDLKSAKTMNIRALTRKKKKVKKGTDQLSNTISMNIDSYKKRRHKNRQGKLKMPFTMLLPDQKVDEVAKCL